MLRVWLLGGPWVVMTGVISPLIWFFIVTLLITITPFITTPEPPSRPSPVSLMQAETEEEPYGRDP